MPSALASIACLAIVAVLCAVGAFSRAYPDNMLQRIGMSSMGVWCTAQAVDMIQSMHTDSVQLMLHIGLATFAVGTALRVRQVHRAPHCRRAEDLPMQARHLSHVAGGRRHH